MGKMHFTVICRDKKEGDEFKVELNLPGNHNVLNALAAIAVALELNIKTDSIQTALSQFKGVDRRFQNLWNSYDTRRRKVHNHR
jgi:UDP-N-acetylmuramate--alanine ligase